MTLNANIAELLGQIPQAQAASLMGYDGLPVAVCTRGEPAAELSSWLTEYAQTLVSLRRAAIEVPDAGVPVDVVIHTPVATVLLRPVHQDYYLAVVQHPEAPHGRARFFMEATAGVLSQEL